MHATFLINGEPFPMGKDDLIDYLSQYGYAWAYADETDWVILSPTPKSNRLYPFWLVAYLAKHMHKHGRGVLVHDSIASTYIHENNDLAEGVRVYLERLGKS